MSSRQQSFPLQPDWTSLGSDLTEHIFSFLPIRSLIRSSSVCKLWNTLISDEFFSTRFSASKKPWFFLFGLNNVYFKNNQSFAYDPESNEWIQLSSSLFPTPYQNDESSSFMGASGYFFASSTPSRFSYTRILNPAWRDTSPLRFSRFNPLVGVYNDKCGASRFIVVGGVRFIGGLVDIEDRLAVEIYNPRLDNWELCPPLPADFRYGNSSQWLSSALFKEKFYVFGINSFSVSSFDMNKHCWSDVQTLRPPGVMFSFLMTVGDSLVLAGLCNSPQRGPSFVLWNVDENSLEFSEVAIMPHELLYGLFENDEDEKFASLKCVGLGNLIYVFNEEYHRNYPACVCEFDGKSKACSWKRVPQLPFHVNRFHKVVSFCSPVPLQIA
ncbi:hypothetical protein QQ045_008673 [Rhodiola kirilowii]